MKVPEELYRLFNKVTTVNFDLDGSLIRSERAWVKSELDLLRGYGVECSPESIRDITQEYLIGRGQDEAARFYKDKFDLSASVEEIRDKRIQLAKKYYGKAPMIEGGRELLEFLSRTELKITLASSAPRELIEMFLESNNLRSCFDAVVSDDEVPQSKPEPYIFLKAAQKVNSRPKDCLVIEDSANGLIAAARAEMHCIMIPNGYVPRPEEDILKRADFVIDKLTDIDLEKLESVLSS